MPNNSNQENKLQNDVSSDKIKHSSENETSEKKALTFKDWKSLKDSQNNTKEISQNNRNVYRPKSTNSAICNAGGDYRNSCNNNTCNEPRIHNVQRGLNFFAGYNGQSGSVQHDNFNRVNNYNSAFGVRGNCFGPVNGGFDTFNAPNNSFSIPNNFGGNNFNNKFNNSTGLNNFSNSSILNSFGNGINGSNKGNNFNLPENFFSSDAIYRQKDFMQKPLPNNNPFRNEEKANQLLHEFDKSRYTKDDKKKKGNKKSADDARNANSSINNIQTTPGDIRKLSNEPKVYVPNPKAKIDGKPYIPKPKIPEQNLEITKEEKKQQWKEYREAMKPFKNREFYNAKRVVQRLGKKAPSELDEKQIIRLSNAREIMEAHKAHLSAKYANYIKAEDSSSELGELYVLKKKPLNDSDFAKTKQFQNHGNFGERRPCNDFEPGRQIFGSGGCTGFKGFVTGGILDGTM